jgi:hypothetical protein
LVTVEHSHVPLATMPPSSVTLPMTTRHAFVSHPAQRRRSLAAHAPSSGLLQAVDVSTSHCLRLAEHTTNIRPNATSAVQLVITASKSTDRLLAGLVLAVLR